MIIRNLDENGDWTLGAGKGNYLTKDDAIALHIKTRVLSWLGDCFFAQTEGIDWYNRLGSKNQLVLLNLDLRRIILQSFGVTALIDLDLSLQGRNLTATYTINTIYSTSYQNSIKSGINA